MKFFNSSINSSMDSPSSHESMPLSENIFVSFSGFCGLMSLEADSSCLESNIELELELLFPTEFELLFLLDAPPNLEYHKTVIGDYTCHNGEYKGK